MRRLTKVALNNNELVVRARRLAHMLLVDGRALPYPCAGA